METGEKISSFQVIDYVVLIVMLAMCSMIGIFFGYKDYKRQKGNSHQSTHNAEDYLLGGRKMSILPISLSLVATYLSGISLLGLSSEVYVSSLEIIEKPLTILNFL
jgi:solute carrier family 5 (sodium-coupled monocarboxylate transporter), member 8/12